MKIHLIKQLNGSLLPAHDSDHEKLKKVKALSMVECDIKQPRNLKFHKKFFALLNMVYQNQPEDCTIQNFDHFRKYLIKRSGYFEEIQTPTGVTYEADSISFGSMTQETFDKLYSDVLDTIIKIYQWQKSDIVDNLEDFY
jgi:hypothetical protein